MYLSGKQRLYIVTAVAWVTWIAFDSEFWGYRFPYGGWREFLLIGLAPPITIVVTLWIRAGFARDSKEGK